jgi:exodeoxyribonuclease VII small subunit
LDPGEGLCYVQDVNEKTPERTPSFEESMAQLEAIIVRIESGGAGLEESLKEYERAMGLLAHCQKVLANAELKIEELNRRGADTGDRSPPESGG